MQTDEKKYSGIAVCGGPDKTRPTHVVIDGVWEYAEYGLEIDAMINRAMSSQISGFNSAQSPENHLGLMRGEVIEGVELITTLETTLEFGGSCSLDPLKDSMSVFKESKQPEIEKIG